MLACRALSPVTTQRSTPLSPTRRTGADASEVRGRSRIKNLRAGLVAQIRLKATGSTDTR
jgi:hypothetical protein